MTRQTFTVTGMHCGSCGLLIDDALEELEGVIRSTTNVRTGTTIVDTTTVDPAEIIAAITAAGYAARPATPG